jgi:cysteinyl-tRNA synthetase
LAAKGFAPMAIRYALLSGHPRNQLNFTFDSLHAAESALGQLRNLLLEICARAGEPTAGAAEKFDAAQPDRTTVGSFGAAFAALKDDLNTPTALGEIFSVRKLKYGHSPTQMRPAPANAPGTFSAGDADQIAASVGRTKTGSAQPDVSAAEDYRALKNLLYVLGLTLHQEEKKVEVPSEITALAEKRWAAKKAKDFALADALRKELSAAGWSMLDGKDGYKLQAPAK